MLGVTHYTTYALGTLLVILVPGPNSMYVLSVATRRGARAGYMAAAGVFFGDATLILLTSLGAASVLRELPVLFDAVKAIGSLYLLFIGWAMLRAAVCMWQKPSGEMAGVTPASPVTRKRELPFRRALVISLLNPKAILFLLSFFVQFVNPSYKHPLVAFAVLGETLQLFSVLYLTVLIFAGTRLASTFRRRGRLSASLTIGVGVLFLGFAIRLALASLG